jgi:plastocyanin
MEESESSMLNKSNSPTGTYILMGLLLLLVVGGVYYFAVKSRGNTATDNSMLDETPSANVESVGAPVIPEESPSSASPSMVESTAPELDIAMTGANYKFSPATINAKVGQTVKVTLTSGDMPHNFMIDELNVKSDTVKKGQSTSVTFTPAKAGTYEYYCSIGNHRAMGMVGKLTVTE